MQGGRRRVLQVLFVVLAVAAHRGQRCTARQNHRSSAGTLNIYGYGPGRRRPGEPRDLRGGAAHGHDASTALPATSTIRSS